MIFRGASRTLVIACIAIAFGATACDKLGLGGKKDESSSSDDDSSSSKKKKKSKKKKSSDDDDDDDTAPSATATATATATPTASATAEPSAAPTASASAAAPEDSGDVKRYPDETPDHGPLGISKPSPAHKEATTSSEIVLTLQPGSQVTRVARYKTWTLVTWKNKSGDHYGWIDNSTSTVIIDRDAGPASIEGLDKRTFDAGVKPTVPDAGKK